MSGKRELIKRVSSGSQLQSTPRIRIERVIAWSFVACAHLFFVWLATRQSEPRPVHSPAMGLVFIKLPSPSSLVNAAAIKPHAAHNPPKAIRPLVRTDIALTGPPPKDDMAARPLQVTTADDRWSSSSAIPKESDGISFSRNKLTTSFNPIQASTPPRLRLRREWSPRDVLRAVSAGLFWPPGYTDDPCGGLAKAVENLSTGSTEREHKLLEDAALQQSRYCS